LKKKTAVVHARTSLTERSENENTKDTVCHAHAHASTRRARAEATGEKTMLVRTTRLFVLVQLLCGAALLSLKLSQAQVDYDDGQADDGYIGAGSGGGGGDYQDYADPYNNQDSLYADYAAHQQEKAGGGGGGGYVVVDDEDSW
jgi:hypothetical protein